MFITYLTFAERKVGKQYQINERCGLLVARAVGNRIGSSGEELLPAMAAAGAVAAFPGKQRIEHFSWIGSYSWRNLLFNFIEQVM
ncbi:hypothetical protein ACLOJK_008569 [Asimina triloba]